MSDFKECCDCHEVKPLEAFSLRGEGRGGRNTSCRACRAAFSREWRMRPERVQQRALRKAISRDGRLNPEEWKAKKQIDRLFRLRAWRAKNPYADRVLTTRRRARKAGVEGDITGTQFEARWAYYGGRCYLCGVEADSIDHVIPMSRGGPNWPSNVRPVCKSCNSSKNDRPLAEYLAS